jgi:hypothetical protein
MGYIWSLQLRKFILSFSRNDAPRRPHVHNSCMFYWWCCHRHCKLVVLDLADFKDDGIFLDDCDLEERGRCAPLLGLKVSWKYISRLRKCASGWNTSRLRKGDLKERPTRSNALGHSIAAGAIVLVHPKSPWWKSRLAPDDEDSKAAHKLEMLQQTKN